MSHHDLPDRWDHLPLDEPTLLADVVDLFLRLEDRTAGALLALATGHDARLLAPIVVDDVPLGCDTWSQHRTVQQLALAVSQVCPEAGLALAVGRPGAPVQTAWDDGWRRALELSCEETGMLTLGCYLATPDVVLRMQQRAMAA